MQKIFLFIVFTFLAFGVFFISCKKTNNSNNNNIKGEPAAKVARSQPGIVSISQSLIVIKQGGSFTLSAKLYNSDGNNYLSTVNFKWSIAGNSGVITYSTSNIGNISTVTGNGLDTGTVTLTVDDGAHMKKSVIVNVVSSTTVIPSNLNFISFSQPIFYLNVGESHSIMSTLTSASGNTISGSPHFFVKSASGAPIFSGGVSVSGGLIMAGSVPGLYFIYGVLGSDTLNGLATVLVYSGSSLSSTDTLWKISGIEIYPYIFHNPGVTGLPIIIDVVGIVKCSQSCINPIVTTSFSISPDNISIFNNDIISLSNGCLQSVVPGSSQVNLYYQSDSCVLYSGVRFDITGLWRGGDLSVQFDYNHRFDTTVYIGNATGTTSPYSNNKILFEPPGLEKATTPSCTINVVPFRDDFTSMYSYSQLGYSSGMYYNLKDFLSSINAKCQYMQLEISTDTTDCFHGLNINWNHNYPSNLWAIRYYRDKGPDSVLLTKNGNIQPSLLTGLDSVLCSSGSHTTGGVMYKAWVANICFTTLWASLNYMDAFSNISSCDSAITFSSDYTFTTKFTCYAPFLGAYYVNGKTWHTSGSNIIMSYDTAQIGGVFGIYTDTIPLSSWNTNNLLPNYAAWNTAFGISCTEKYIGL